MCFTVQQRIAEGGGGGLPGVSGTLLSWSVSRSSMVGRLTLWGRLSSVSVVNPPPAVSSLASLTLESL